MLNRISPKLQYNKLDVKKNTHIIQHKTVIISYIATLHYTLLFYIVCVVLHCFFCDCVSKS